MKENDPVQQRLTQASWFVAARAVALVLVDLAVAAGAWLIMLRNVMVWYEFDTLPASCSNYYGRSMSCDSSTLLAQLVSLVTFCVVLLGLLWAERKKGWL